MIRWLSDHSIHVGVAVIAVAWIASGIWVLHHKREDDQ